MATMEGGSNFDPTAVCSVCLLPFVGRQPKILPCFHTFCLPCLTSMVKHQTVCQTAMDQRLDADYMQTTTRTRRHIVQI